MAEDSRPAVRAPLMNDILIEEHTVAALKGYLHFLSEFPAISEKIEARSDTYRKKGHELRSPPDIPVLVRTASSSESNWRSILTLLPVLGNMGSRLVRQLHDFLQSFDREVQALSSAAESTLIKDLNAQHFAPILSGTQEPLDHTDVQQLLKNVSSLIEECTFTGVTLEQIVEEDSNLTHTFLTHFIDALRTAICACHPSVSKFEIYYYDGLFSTYMIDNHLALYCLPDVCTKPHDIYLKALRELHVNARLAGSSLGFLCSRMLLFLKDINGEILSLLPETPVRLAITTLKQIDYLLADLNKISDALISLSSTLNPSTSITSPTKKI